MDKRRVRILKTGNEGADGPVIYWMSRDQRVADNWALIHAQELARSRQSKLYVVFALTNEFPGGNSRSYSFMIESLKAVESNLLGLNIPFIILKGAPENTAAEFANYINCSQIICDFDTLKIKKYWKKELLSKVNAEVCEVDAHNIVPCFFASDKEEFAAYTIRPKLNRLLNEFLDEFPQIERNEFNSAADFRTNDYSLPYGLIDLAPAKAKPGEIEAKRTLDVFLKNKLHNYDQGRNFPGSEFTSELSPYLHFGQISAQRIVIETKKLDLDDDNSKAFIEELFIRRELADNYCNYCENYDNFSGFKPWAQESLNLHRSDKRSYNYNIKSLETAQTHDEYWNAAQTEAGLTGKMHGYMRMYWAKKILEWTESPEAAQETAIYLNDKYFLDGRDPNGYTGIAWSIGGIHDRAWGEREIFGKIRYMNAAGIKRKFNPVDYVKKYSNINRLF